MQIKEWEAKMAARREEWKGWLAAAVGLHLH
jgi:hypothetical protein